MKSLVMFSLSLFSVAALAQISANPLPLSGPYLEVFKGNNKVCMVRAEGSMSETTFEGYIRQAYNEKDSKAMHVRATVPEVKVFAGVLTQGAHHPDFRYVLYDDGSELFKKDGDNSRRLLTYAHQHCKEF